MKIKEKLRLIDLENISSEKPNYSKIIKEVLGFNNFIIGKKYVFAKKFKQAFHLVNQARNINPKEVEYNEDCNIKKPNSIDNITFRAMMELQSIVKSNTTHLPLSEYMATVICIACYSENNEGDYNSNCVQFNNFYKKILLSPLWEMVGLYNWIDSSLDESDKEWIKRFLSVHVEDKDYEQAGGHRMAQFNVLNTIKSICQDFNCSYDEAWQKSYALTQTNSYSKATANHIQDQIRILKEARMKKERSSQVR